MKPSMPCFSSSLLFLCSILLLSTVATTAQEENVVQVNKPCYISGEAIVAIFKDLNPKPFDWIGIIKYTWFGFIASYDQYVFTCGTALCNSTGPVNGTVSLYNGLDLNRYRAVLLSENTYNVLAYSSPFDIATSCPSVEEDPTPTTTDSVSVVKPCYSVQEGIQATFTVLNPEVGNMIGLIEASADLNSRRVVYQGWVKTCGTYNCTTAPSRGLVSVFSEVPPGSYKAVLLRGRELTPLAVSSNFTFADVCPYGSVAVSSSPSPSPSQPPTTLSPTTIVPRISLSPTKRPVLVALTTKQPTKRPTMRRTAPPTTTPPTNKPTKRPRRRTARPTTTPPTNKPTKRPSSRRTAKPTTASTASTARPTSNQTKLNRRTGTRSSNTVECGHCQLGLT